MKVPKLNIMILINKEKKEVGKGKLNKITKNPKNIKVEIIMSLNIMTENLTKKMILTLILTPKKIKVIIITINMGDCMDLNGLLNG